MFIKLSKYLVFFLFLPVFVTGQEADFDMQFLSVKEGLSHRKINNICESKEGYIWLSTNYGLNRYDGQEIKVYRSTIHGLYRDQVDRIHATSDNRLLLFYGASLIKNERRIWDVQEAEVFDVNTEEVLPFSALTGKYEILPSEIHGSYQDKDFRVWIWTRDGDVFVYDDRLELLHSFPQWKGFNQLLPGQNGEVWLFFEERLIHLDSTGEVLSEEKFPYRLRRMFIDDEGEVWLHTEFIQRVNGVKTFLFKKGKEKDIQPYTFEVMESFSLEGLDNDEFNIVKVDSHGRIWMTFRNEIYMIDSRAKDLATLSFIESVFTDMQKLSDVFIHKSGLIFLGNSDGLYKLDYQEEGSFEILLAEKDRPVSTRSILDYNKDSLLIFAYGQNYLVNKKDNGYTPAPLFDYTTCYRVIRDNTNTYWGGCHGLTLVKFQPEKSSIELIDQVAIDQLNLSVLRPFQDKNTGRIWIGLEKGLSYYDPEINKVVSYTREGDSFDLHDQLINDFYQNEEGLWLASTNGIYLYQEGKGIVEHFLDFPFLNVNDIYEDEDEDFWLATLGGGLVKWDRRTNKKEVFDTKFGFSNNVIYTVIEDDYGYLWLPSDNGIMQFDKETQVVNIHYPFKGMGNDEFNNESYYQAEDGYLYFGGVNGVVKFHPRTLSVQLSQEQDLLVKEINKSDSETGRMVNISDEYREKKSISISPGEKFFELKVAFLDFKSASDISFAYQVEKVDDDWIYTKENNIRINRLPYGKHNLRIKGKGQSDWSSKELLIPIHVISPIYKRPWFVVLSILTALGLIGLFFKWRIQFLEKEKIRLESEVEKRTEEISQQNEKLAALVDTKNQFFGIIAHDLRGPMLSFRGLNEKIQYLIDHKQEDRLKELGLSVDSAYCRLERLLDNLLNWALVKKGNLPFYPQTVELYTLTNEVIEVFDDIATNKNVSIINKINPLTKVFADSNALSSIFRNLLDNAIKYAPDNSSIYFSAEIINNTIQCQIKDEGVGIEKKDLKTIFEFDPLKRKKNSKDGGTGLGLQLCKELIGLHNGKIWIESEINNGTAVYFSLPLQPD